MDKIYQSIILFCTVDTVSCDRIITVGLVYSMNKISKGTLMLQGTRSKTFTCSCVTIPQSLGIADKPSMIFALTETECTFSFL